MKNELIIPEEFNSLLFRQRHECRTKRQRVRVYGGKELYQELYKSYVLFQPYLPTKLENVLDIGCGLGYIDVVINDYQPGLNYYLFDSLNGEANTVHAFYNNLQATERFLQLNGIPSSAIHLVDATSTGTDDIINLDKEVFKSLPKMDLVISQFYWCWHTSPLKFIEEVAEQINPGGLLVLDLNVFYKALAQETFPKYGFEILFSEEIIEKKILLIARKM